MQNEQCHLLPQGHREEERIGFYGMAINTMFYLGLRTTPKADSIIFLKQRRTVHFSKGSFHIAQDHVTDKH